MFGPGIVRGPLVPRLPLVVSLPRWFGGEPSVMGDGVVVELELSASVWTDVTADVLVNPGVTASYGIQGNGPKDRVASTGTLSFSLNNSETNAAGVQGRYSPNHTNQVAGFDRGTAVRLTMTHLGTSYYKFRGRLVEIAPVAGENESQHTRCLAHDWIDDAASLFLRDIAPQANKRADEVVTAILDAAPVAARPTATNFDVGTQVMTFPLHDLGQGEAALSALAKTVQSEFGFLSPVGDTTQGGTLRFFNRHSRQGVASSETLSNTMVDVRVPTGLGQVYNRVVTTTHPLRVDAEPTTVLFTLPTQPVSVRPVIAPAEQRTFRVEYRDPTSDETLIGGTAGVTPVQGTDYAMNSKADGLGTDISSDFSVVTTYFATSAEIDVTNNGAVFGYVTLLQGRGKGIYDRAPLLHQSSSVQAYGERRIEIDMPYQTDANVGKGIADFVEAQYQALGNQIDSVRFEATSSAALLLAAHVREPGDKVTITETVTGLSSVEAFIQRVRLHIAHGGAQIQCEWGLAPDVEGDFWILGTSQLGVDTVLGYA